MKGKKFNKTRAGLASLATLIGSNTMAQDSESRGKLAPFETNPNAILENETAWAKLGLEKPDEITQGTQPWISFNSNTEFLSKYITYGMTYSDNPVIQETLTASIGNFNISGFSNYDTKTGKVNETDLFVDGFITPNDNITLFGGYALYDSPTNLFPTTHEIFGGVTAEQMPFRPTLMLVHDIDKYGGLYGQASLTHDQELSILGKNTSLSLEAVLGYNAGYYREDSGLTNVEGKLSLPITIGDATLETSIRYIHSLDESFTDNNLVYGFSISIPF